MKREPIIYNWDAQPLVLTPHQVGLIIGLSDDKVRQLINAGYIRAFKLSARKWGISRDSLRRQIEEGSFYIE